MLKKYLIPTIAAVIALAACSKEIQEQRVQPADSDNVHTLSVEIESGAYEALDEDTKASMEAVIRVKWKQGDEVSVVNASTGNLLGGCLMAKSDGEIVVFEGTVAGTINQGDQLYYIYPRIKNNADEESFASCNVSLAGQIYDGENIGNVCFYGYAEDQAGSTDNDISKKIKFNLVTSYAQLSMANLPAKNSGLSRIDISNVNEGFTWTLSGNALSAAGYTGKNAISVKCSNVNISKAGNAVIRFAIPASDVVSAARVITVNNAYKNEKYTKNKLEPSAYYNQLYTTWTENVAQVNTDDPSKTKVTIDNNNSKDVAEGAIPTEAFGTTGQTSKPTEVSIGGMGTVTFDEDATARILGNADDAGATSVLLKVEDVTTTKPVENADVVYEVTMKTLDENGTEVFPDAQGTADAEKPGTATISINLDPDVMYVHTISLVKDDGTPIDGGVIPESIVLDLTNHILTFKVEHFSKYAVGYVKKDKFVAVTGVSLNKNALTLPVGDNETLVATVAPDNATNPKVKWTSSNTAVATVDKDGKVAAVAHGTATITVTTEDGSKTATCIVTVKAPIKYTVTFDLNGIPGTAPTEQTVDENGKVTKPEDPTAPDGCIVTFKGWYKTKDETTGALSDEWDFDTDEVTSDITLYAQWETTISQIVGTNKDVPELENFDWDNPGTAEIPEDAWVDATSGNKAFWVPGEAGGFAMLYKEETEDDFVFHAFGPDDTDIFFKVGDKYVCTNDYGTFTCTMTNGVFTSLTFEGNDLSEYELLDFSVFDGTYAAPKIPAPIETDKEEDIL